MNHVLQTQVLANLLANLAHSSAPRVPILLDVERDDTKTKQFLFGLVFSITLDAKTYGVFGLDGSQAA